MKLRKHKSVFKRITAFLTIISVLVLVSIGTLAAYAASSIDFSVDEVLFSSVQKDNITKFYYDASGNCGKILSQYIPVEFSSVSGATERRDWMPIEDFSENIKNAFIATEDRSFYSHHGVSLKRTGAAIINYLMRGGSDFGGSTITQQVVKNISGDNEKTVRRKINEIIRAYHLELLHSKDDIFEVYLNIVPMGEGICGIGLASEYFFDKSPSELTIAESATLVGMANAPTKYNPYSNYDACLKRRSTVLYSMLECGYITSEEYSAAKSSPITLNEKREHCKSVSSWFVETVCDELCDDLVVKNSISKDAARILILNGGLSVYTTMDARAQKILEEYFESKCNFTAESGSPLQCSMVVTDSETADLLAVIGNSGKKQGSRLLNNATVAHIPGSTLKPLALYAPLIDSHKITWATVFDDVPTRFNTVSDGDLVEFPRNSPEGYDGLTTISTAIKKSKNTIAVQLYDILGADKIFDRLYYDYGFTSLVHQRRTSAGVLTDRALSPLALGQLTDGVTLRRLTESYTAFSADGMLSDGRSYAICLDSSNNVLIKKDICSKRITSVEAARVMNQLLMNVTATGTASKITLKHVIDVAGKTGTSGNSLDKLFVGYTPYYTAGIWYGYSDGKTSVVGNDHLSDWDAVMTKLHADMLSAHEIKSFKTEGLIYAPYCMDSGKLYSPWCTADPRGSRLEYGYFIRGTAPTASCDVHILCHLSHAPEAEAGPVSMLNIKPRSFPKEIHVSDDEYIYSGDAINEENGEHDGTTEDFRFERRRRRKIFSSLQI